MTYEQPTPWSPDVLTRFKDLLRQDGLTLKEIAAILTRDFGVLFTKNACVGKSRRLGMMKRSHWIEPRSIVRNAGATKRKLVPRRKPVPPPMPRRPGQIGRLKITDLESYDCRWPTENTDPVLYCGQRKLDTSPYCAQHTKIAWR